MDKMKVFRKSQEINDHSDISDGVVLQVNDKLHTLNETALNIFNMFDGVKTIGEVIDEMAARYPDDDVSAITEGFIAMLHEASLLVE